MRISVERCNTLSFTSLNSRFLAETIIGRNIDSDFFLLAKKLADEAGYGSLPYYPDDVWERAEREFKLPGERSGK